MMDDELLSEAFEEADQLSSYSDGLSEGTPNIVYSFEDAVKNKEETRIIELISTETVFEKDDDDDNTFLHIVAKYGTVETAIQLLDCGADVHAKTTQGKTPLFFAFKNSLEIVKVLLLHGSRVNDWDLFRLALLYGTEEVLELILKKSLLDIQDDCVRNVIYRENFKIEDIKDTETMVNAFLESELYFSHLEDSYPLLIFFAARICRKDILHIILDDCRKYLGEIMVIRFEDDRFVKHKPQDPQELNCQGRYGITALHCAVRRQRVEVVQFLLEEGADPNCQDDFDLTPLYFASCREIHLKLRGYDDSLTRNDLNVMYDAFYEDEFKHFVFPSVYNPKILKLLLENGANPNSRIQNVPILLKACENGSLETVKILLEFGANIRALDNRKNTALHYAALGTSLEIVDLLLEKGFDIDVRNDDDYSAPLSFAVKKLSLASEMLEHLVNRGANINAINAYGETALHTAIRFNTTYVNSLLELGADWSILSINEIKIDDYYLTTCICQCDLISYIALRENNLSYNIKFYVGNNDEELNKAFDHFFDSKIEITKLKKRIISEDNKISYFDFLIKDFYSCVQIAKNSEVRNFFLFREYMPFLCYGNLLEYRFKLTQELDNVVDKTFDFMLHYTNLPSEIVKLILRYFCAIDFRNFGKVLSDK